MKRFALIGCGIGYTRSPVVHGEICRLSGKEAGYDVLDFSPAELSERVKRLRENCDGFNITKPYKTDVIPYLDKLDKSADEAGAVNTAARAADGTWIGYNTDTAGFADSLVYHRIDLAGRNALILGAGGAARAVAGALRKTCAAVAVYNRTYRRAADLADSMAGLSGCRLTAVSELPRAGSYAVINCTSAGLKAGETPVPADFEFGAFEAAVDLIYDPRETAFLRAARRAGLRTANGAAMLFYQAREAQSIWQGRISLTDEQIKRIIETI